MPKPPKKRGIRCPACGMTASHVIRTASGSDYLTRRRECGACGTRYTTTERLYGKLPPDMAGSAISVGQLQKMVEIAIGKAT